MRADLYRLWKMSKWDEESTRNRRFYEKPHFYSGGLRPIISQPFATNARKLFLKVSVDLLQTVRYSSKSSVQFSNYISRHLHILIWFWNFFPHFIHPIETNYSQTCGVFQSKLVYNIVDLYRHNTTNVCFRCAFDVQHCVFLCSWHSPPYAQRACLFYWSKFHISESEVILW